MKLINEMKCAKEYDMHVCFTCVGKVLRYLRCIRNLHSGVKNKSHNNALMVSEVRRVLTKILGGGLNCIRSGVYSQYHYYLGR